MADLDTLIQGSPNECRAGVAWFRRVEAAAEAAADSTQQARVTGAGGWYGPAADAFARAAVHPRDVCDDISYSSKLYAKGLEEFADCIEHLVKRMDAVVEKAGAGGLTVERDLGYIKPPDPAMLGQQPAKPQIPRLEQPGEDAMEEYRAQVDAYNLRVDEYNRKVALFNECGTLVKQIRVEENQAHVNLRGDLAGEGDANNWRVGDLKIGEIVDGRQAIKDSHDPLFERLRQIDEEAGHYTTIASAEKQAHLDKKVIDWIRRDVADDNKHLLTLLSRFKADGTMPPELRTKANAAPTGNGEYAGRRTGHGGAREATGATKVARVMKTVGKGIPFLGDGITFIDEIADVARGRQTISAAMARSVGIIGAGLAGGFIGANGGRVAGLLAGGRFGPHGALVGAALGGTIGGVALDWAFSDQMDKDMRASIERNRPDELNPGQNQAKATNVSRMKY